VKTINILKEIKYHLIDKWQFIYLAKDIISYKHEGINIKDVSFKKAKSEDLIKIKSDIFPFIENMHSDKKELKKNLNTCFLGLKNDKIIHYFLTYENPKISPLFSGALFNKQSLLKTDAYLGSTFTIPSERGSWIAPSSLLYIINFYKVHTSKKRLLVLVHKDTLGAVDYYKKFGFYVMNNVAPKNILEWFLLKIKISK